MTVEQVRQTAEKSIGQALGHPFFLDADQKRLLHVWAAMLNDENDAEAQAFLSKTARLTETDDVSIAEV